jgi:hypothetical protein
MLTELSIMINSSKLCGRVAPRYSADMALWAASATKDAALNNSWHSARRCKHS